FTNRVWDLRRNSRPGLRRPPLESVRSFDDKVLAEKESPMAVRVTRREFLERTTWGGGGAAALAAGVRPGRGWAATSPYPDWIPASTKPPKRGGTLTRASQWDPPGIDPRMTQSVGLFQFAGLTSSRLIRYAFPDEGTGTNDFTRKGALAESWQANADHRVWTFKLRQGVKWQNLPPLNG